MVCSVCAAVDAIKTMRAAGVRLRLGWWAVYPQYPLAFNFERWFGGDGKHFQDLTSIEVRRGQCSHAHRFKAARVVTLTCRLVYR